jgi:hypothetical protein
MSATRAGRGQGLHAYATVGSYGCRFHNIMRGLQATPAARRPDQPAALSQEAPYARPSSASTSYALVDRQRVETIIIGARRIKRLAREGLMMPRTVSLVVTVSPRPAAVTGAPSARHRYDRARGKYVHAPATTSLARSAAASHECRYDDCRITYSGRRMHG